MEAVGLGLPAWLDRGSDLRAAVFSRCNCAPRFSGQGKHALPLVGTVHINELPGDMGRSDWQAWQANGVVTGDAKQSEKRQI